jgi:hypothetical protein
MDLVPGVTGVTGEAGLRGLVAAETLQPFSAAIACTMIEIS